MERNQRAIPGKVFGQILAGLREPQPFFESKTAAKDYMEERITKRRTDFIEEYRKGFHGSSVLTYEPALDREVYKELRKHRMLHTDAYQEVLRGLNSYTKFQVETFIGERLNVGLSKFRYDLDFADGVGILHGQGMDEPLLEMIARGRDTRGFVSTDVDIPRQEAEVVQFQKIQEVMGNPQTEVGTTVISFSPPGQEGSSYAHNFYDVFILKEDSQKERYVEARRYASGLSAEQSLQKADTLKDGYTQELTGDMPVDAFLISRPLVLDKDHEFFNKPDDIHKFLQGDPKAMSYDDFQKKVLQDSIFSEMVGQYLHVLEDDPGNKEVLNRILNATMNRADEAAGLKEAIAPAIHGRRGGVRGAPLPIMVHINNYGKQEVRSASTGCGSSGGFGQESKYGSSRMPGNMSPTKSSDVLSGEDKYGKRTFECPSCGYTNVRPLNQLLPECQNPGECSNRKAVAC